MKSIFKNTWAVLTEKERKHFLLLIVLDFLISLADIFSLFLLLWLVQFYVQPNTNRQFYFLPAWLFNKNSIAFVALFFVFFSLKNIAGFFITKAHYQLSSDVAIRISENNLIKFQQGSFEDFVQVDSSEYVRKIAFQPFEFCQHILAGLQQIITQFCLISITVIGILFFNAKLFVWLLCLLLLPVSLVFYLMKKRLSAARSQIRSSNEISYRYLFDALKGYVEGNIFNRNSFFLQRFLAARRRFSKHLFESLSLQHMPSRMIEIFAVMGLFILIVIAKWTGNNNGTNLLTIGAFMAAAYKIIPGLVKIINLTGQIKAYEFIPDDYEKKRTINRKANTQPKEIHSIQLKNIRFQYSGIPAFQNFSLCMKKGDFIGIMGKSGKGKTTLLNILLGFLPSQDGEVVVNEQATDHQTLKTFWPSIAYVRQQCFLIHDTILRNITLTEDAYNPQQLSFALKISGLDELVQQSAKGLQNVIAENGKNISGGQQQRIALARALYKNADLILLDEPFNELDETSEISLLQYFQNIAATGKIVVMITHNQKALSFCTKTISLDEN